MRKLVSLLFVFVLLSSPLEAAVAFVGNNSPNCDSGGTAGTTTITCSITIPSMSNGVLFCAVGFNEAGAFDPTGTWNTSENFTQIGEMGTATTGRYQWAGYVPNPTATTANVVLSNLSSTSREALACWWMSGVHQTTPTNGLDTSTLSNSCGNPFPTATITTTSGDMIVSFGSSSNNGSMATVSGTNDSLILSHANGVRVGAARDTGSSNDTISWDTGANPACSAMGWNVVQAGGGAPAHNKPLRNNCLTLGVCDDSNAAFHNPLEVLGFIFNSLKSLVYS